MQIWFSQIELDPNDDAEVFSGPINSNAGDNDYDYFGSFVPRVRVFLIPSRPAADDYYYDYPDVQQRPSFDSLFNIVKSFLGARWVAEFARVLIWFAILQGNGSWLRYEDTYQFTQSKTYIPKVDVNLKA